MKLLGGNDRAAAAQAAAVLVEKAADGSNLTLDPDRDSFYPQDVVTVKLPSAVAGLAFVVDTVPATAGHGLSAGEDIVRPAPRAGWHAHCSTLVERRGMF